jgi:histidine triad (HIT) family protein
MDHDTYRTRVKSGPCFVCAFLAGDPAYAHETVLEDDENVAFLDRYPTVAGKVLVASKLHAYLYTLGSQQGNSHLHWHIAGLPPGVPYDRQQFHALMTENGVLGEPEYDARDTARLLRQATTWGA